MTKDRSKTWCGHAADEIRERSGCPMACEGTVIRMTRAGFKAACLQIQKRRRTRHLEYGLYNEELNICNQCKKGLAIREGRSFRPPRWARFYPLKQLMEERK